MRPSSNSASTQRLQELQLDSLISFSRVKNCKDTSPVSKTLTIREFVEGFRTPKADPGKLNCVSYHSLNKDLKTDKAIMAREKDGPAMILATFRESNTRVSADLDQISGICLDFDKGISREEIETKLAGTFAVVHTTYSSRIEKPRWRAVIPFETPCPPNQFNQVFEHFSRLFGSDLDPCSKSPAQIWYEPACPHDLTNDYVTFTVTGELFNVAVQHAISELQAEATRKQTIPARENSEKSASKEIAHAKFEIHNTTLVDHPDSSKIKSALENVSSDDRRTWVLVGMALQHHLGQAGYELWCEWSKSSRKFDEEDSEYNWNTFKDRDDGVRIGTLYYMARQNGWAPPPDVSHAADIAELNASQFVARENGKTIVWREVTDPKSGSVTLQRQSTKDMIDFYRNRVLTIQTGSKVRTISLGEYWLQHSDRRTYDDVVFAPNQEVSGCYNLWRGFAVSSNKGNWELMKRHIREVICNGDNDLYRFVVGWMAYTVQHPDRAGEVALVLLGPQGCGKGVFARGFGQLFGQHYQQVSQARHLLGNFNAHLANCVLLFVDEAFWAGDKQAEGTLKALITEPDMMIEPKGINAYRVQNHLHIIVASNNDWVVPSGARERRHCVLTVADTYAQDHSYFAPLYAELENGGLNAMLFELQNMDISQFNVRKIPFTTALRDQMLYTLSPEWRWWMEELQEGTIWRSQPKLVDGSKRGIAQITIDRSELQQKFSEGCRGLHATRSNATALGMLLKKLLPSGYPKDLLEPVKLRNGSSKVRCYVLPPLAECIAHFERTTGISVSFEGGEGETGDNLNNLSNLYSKSIAQSNTPLTTAIN